MAIDLGICDESRFLAAGRLWARTATECRIGWRFDCGRVRTEHSGLGGCVESQGGWRRYSRSFRNADYEPIVRFVTPALLVWLIGQRVQIDLWSLALTLLIWLYCRS